MKQPTLDSCAVSEPRATGTCPVFQRRARTLRLIKRAGLNKWLYFVFVLAGAFSACVSGSAEDWPLARGDLYGSGISRSPLPDAPQLVWQYSSAEDAGFDATPVVAGGVAYIGDSAGTFHAVRISDGQAVWKKELSEAGFSAAAAVGKDHIYAGDMDGNIYCLKPEDGTIVWQEKIDGEVHAGPSIHGDDLLLTCESGTLSCRNKQDGKERWSFRIDAPLRCTPTIAAGRAALAGCDSKLHVIDVLTGSEVGAVDIDGPTGATPSMRGDQVFFGTESGTFFAITIPTSSDGKPTVAWSYRDPQRNQAIRAAAAVDDRIVVYGSQGKAVYGLHPKTGEQLWKVPTKARIESSPVIAGDAVLVATASGKILILDLLDGTQKWEHDAGGSFVAAPAVVNGRFLLANSDGSLYCFGTKTGSTARPPATSEARK